MGGVRRMRGASWGGRNAVPIAAASALCRSCQRRSRFRTPSARIIRSAANASPASIFETPCCRSTKTIGVSPNRAPAVSAARGFLPGTSSRGCEWRRNRAWRARRCDSSERPRCNPSAAAPAASGRRGSRRGSSVGVSAASLRRRRRLCNASRSSRRPAVGRADPCRPTAPAGTSAGWLKSASMFEHEPVAVLDGVFHAGDGGGAQAELARTVQTGDMRVLGLLFRRTTGRCRRASCRRSPTGPPPARNGRSPRPGEAGSPSRCRWPR